MASDSPHRYLFRSEDIAAMPERRHVHQFNDGAIRHTKTLGTQAGLEHIGLHIVRLTQGCVSTEYHTHDNDEEFLFVISGRGVATIGGKEHAVAAGDLMAFPHESPPHQLANPYPEDLVYLMGGERNAADVVHYPNIKRSMVKTAGRRYWSDWEDQKEL